MNGLSSGVYRYVPRELVERPKHVSACLSNVHSKALCGIEWKRCWARGGCVMKDI